MRICGRASRTRRQGLQLTFEIGLVLTILVLSLALFVSEKLRMDVIALLVMGSLVLTELVTPQERCRGFIALLSYIAGNQSVAVDPSGKPLLRIG